MNTQLLLGQLSNLHEMMTQLLESTPEPDCYRSFHPVLAPLAWYLGRAVYLETWWLREQVQSDADMTERVRELFVPGALSPPEQWRQLPPKDHLLNWALELQDENITRLANPGRLPAHPLLTEGRLLPMIIQGQALLYEQILMGLTQRQLQLSPDHQVATTLRAALPEADLIGVAQGHYRIGALDDPAAFDNELPTQVVQLSNFRIQRHPLSNSNWLAFMEAGGYQDPAWWDEPGREWLGDAAPRPDHWRQDGDGNWFGIGLNGPFDLQPEEPVMGISQHEASACASWVSTLGGELSGAVLQHEYQWEVAARTRSIQGQGRVLEWCANRFEPYQGYQTPKWSEARTREFDQRHYSLRGASLHTQRALRRSTRRSRALPESRHLFAGARLVFPFAEA
jgi:iron(II)-dependent oxidoreductase